MTLNIYLLKVFRFLVTDKVNWRQVDGELGLYAEIRLQKLFTLCNSASTNTNNQQLFVWTRQLNEIEKGSTDMRESGRGNKKAGRKRGSGNSENAVFK